MLQRVSGLTFFAKQSPETLLHKLTGFSPNQFMQEIRLQTVREWLENQQYGTVKEVCCAVVRMSSIFRGFF
ncbi:AraC family transcriptional regulator [Larkinella sp. C7]|jgi:transcriptional regulator GlxA family with amidase domain|uniref:AraC family transcriptional regulator n=1 Tax=Larkinella sp. C7 TaxID=2576607 RepID=UPI0011112BB6|nr:AraC family transcriptional regulator [Larkinella sp. C7]